MRNSRPTIRIGLAVGAAVTAVLLSTGCSEDSESTVGDDSSPTSSSPSSSSGATGAGEELCSDLDALGSELTSLGRLVVRDATRDEIEAQSDAVRTAGEAVADSARSFEAAVSDEADRAHQTYQDAIDDIPDDATVSEQVEQYGSAVRTYVSELATIASDAGCGSTGGSGS